MPGLLRGVARTAVIAGTATHVSNNVSRRQANKWSQQEAQEQPQQAAPAEPAQNDEYAELEKLAQLRDQGILTPEEFEAKKKLVLGI
ncbi:SHOCT domain-containing protein [Candidatus Saccharibacteria bacterium]|nr:SHOCT domain-containing protein [Candidatus Saccharibacteria bacterium]